MQPDHAPSITEESISDFRAEHQEALFDKGHLENARRVAELTKMYEGMYAGRDGTVFDPSEGTERPASDLDKAMEDAQETLTAPEYTIGQHDNFGLKFDTRLIEEGGHGWDSALENKARVAFENAGLSDAQAHTVAESWKECLDDSYNWDNARRQSVEALSSEYGAANVDRGLAAATRLL